MLPFAPQIDIDHAYHGICLEWKKTTSITDNRANQDIIHIEEWKVASNRNQSGIRVVLTLDRFAFSLAVNFPLSSTPVDFMFPMNTVRFGEGEPWSCIQKTLHTPGWRKNILSLVCEEKLTSIRYIIDHAIIL